MSTKKKTINNKLSISKIDKEMTEIIEKNICPVYNKFIYGIYGLSLLFNILIVISLIQLEKIDCKCANIPEKRFLKEWFIFNLVFNTLFLLSFIISDKICYFYMLKNSFIYVIISIIYIITFIQLIRLIAYLNIMRRNCECGFGNLEAFLFWYFIIIRWIGIFLLHIIFINNFFIFNCWSI